MAATQPTDGRSPLVVDSRQAVPTDQRSYAASIPRTKRLPAIRTLVLLLAVAVWIERIAVAQQPAPVTPAPVTPSSNTQAETTPRATAQQAAAGMRVPDGFHVDVFAAEPDVQQPIAMTFDGRGRLWVAENYTYAEREVNYDLRYHDRIVILQDTDDDGRADKRTVFWDQGQRLTSVEVGFGGVWALCPPHLLFIPDRDGDDVPDGEPVVMLDGWDASAARHNFVNGLRWGPDGWLYGRNGILATCHVGVPGSAESERQAINCGIWRFHPVTHRFEVVCSGTTNPWGSDWNEFGQMFFINTVIGHLWHVVPGAHLERMYGEDLNPFAYELIPQTADHVHWDAGKEKWSDVRNEGVTESSSRLGGGHAHSGLMIYQGDNWPAAYRGDAFTVNLHGQRVNRDHVQRSGATYVGLHRPDFLTVEDPWFRGLEMLSGPDGRVYLMDWSDIGECHENDGVHRTSGRIYSIRHGQPSPPKIRDVSSLSAAELVELQLHANDWYARQARRELQQRASQGVELSDAARQLEQLFDSQTDVPQKLRALWCLHAIGTDRTEWLLEQLRHENEHVRVWAIQLLVEQPATSPEVVQALVDTADRESSGLVLTWLASALQRLPHSDRWALAGKLIGHASLADDPVLPLMIWYGVEPIVVTSPSRTIELLSQSRMPRVSRLIARRLSATIDEQPEAVDLLVRYAAKTASDPQRLAVVQGMAEALRGWLRAAKPNDWETLVAAVRQAGSETTNQQVRELSVVFGDGRAIRELERMVQDSSLSLDARRGAIRALSDARVEHLTSLVSNLLTDRELGAAAVRALASDRRSETSQLLLEKYPVMPPLVRAAVVESLAARPDSAGRLLAAVQNGKVDRKDVGPFVLRQMQLHGDAALSREVGQLWPDLRLIAADKLQRIADYRVKLTPELVAAADAQQGKRLFEQACGKCHKLFGEGGSIGPELTGAQRSNLNYWLENIIDPSAEVATSFRMSLVVTDDGRVLNGVLGGETGRTLTLQTPQEKLTLDRDTIDQIKPSTLSLMPDGLLNELSEPQLHQLFGYLMAPAPPLARLPSDAAPPSEGGRP